MTAPVDFGGGRVNQISVQIESVENCGLIKPHFGLNPLQRLFIHEERSLHSAIVPPKTNRWARRVIRAALIGKTKRHGPGTVLWPCCACEECFVARYR